LRGLQILSAVPDISIDGDSNTVSLTNKNNQFVKFFLVNNFGELFKGLKGAVKATLQ